VRLAGVTVESCVTVALGEFISGIRYRRRTGRRSVTGIGLRIVPVEALLFAAEQVESMKSP
jgi:hypothetical protein